jgi:hypothetical protein
MKVRFVVLASVGLVSLACGSSTDPGGGGSGPTISELPAAYAEAICDTYLRCFPIVGRSFDAATCTKNQTAEIEASGFSDIEQAVDDGRATYDSSAARECLDALQALPCDEIDAGQPEACDQAIAGTTPLGEDCTLDEECEGDGICDFDAACPGTCIAKLTAGKDCNGQNSRCADGLVCSDATNKCAAPAGKGDACGGGIEVQCAAPLLCLGDDADEDPPRAGECFDAADVQTEALGEPCSFIGDINLCEPDLSCVLAAVDGATLEFECQKFVEEGEPCGVGIPSQCPTGQYCSGVTLLALEGECADMPEAGEPCGDSLGAASVCAAGLVCVDGECAEKRANGQSCDTDEECQSGKCDDGGCAPTVSCE